MAAKEYARVRKSHAVFSGRGERLRWSFRWSFGRSPSFSPSGELKERKEDSKKDNRKTGRKGKGIGTRKGKEDEGY